ncbi:SDR family oxidoreductase [Pseudonocardia sp. H11422]|uniref:SDR family oxidoreductase n=1 Tax=Pseudonocardia sp. H11422 TaxID=2835866 RepID=UPI001BDDBF58|nr:SDR family oxidoreductase [Pseudonocardia sp. H11422]
MDLGITGRRAAVAAASSGLGYASAAALVAEGARVTICSSDAGRAEAAAKQLGGGTGWVVADLTDPDAAARFVEDAAETMGGVDILVVNGPGPAPGTVGETPASAYQAALDRSLLAVVRMCLAATPDMRARGWGRIVAITSLGVRQPYPNLALSNTARAGATGFLRTLAREIAADGVTVNSVQPGLHETDRVSGMYGQGAALERQLETIPAGRLGGPADFGSIVAFLCSEQAGYLTGAAIPVDGGAYQALL